MSKFKVGDTVQGPEPFGEGAIAEGVFNPCWTVVNDNYKRFFDDAWDKINAKRGYPWESNCWVAVYTFRRVER